jgi:hypothetical protein
MGSVSLPSQLEPATLYVMVTRGKGDGRIPPTLTSQADFSIMMKSTPEIGHCHSVFSVGSTPSKCGILCTVHVAEDDVTNDNHNDDFLYISA